MNCRTARRAMDQPGATREAGLARHLEGCDECRKIQAALDQAAAALRSRHAGVVPDAAFVTRVRSRLRHEPVQVLGLAALRVLPVTLLILAVLTWLAFTATPQVQQAEEIAPSDDVLAWVLEDREDSR